jgi:putative membrane protein
MTELIFRYIHFIGIMSVSATLVMQHLIISPEITKKELKKIAFLDVIYWISIVLTLGAGLVLLLGVGKDVSFYMSNKDFHIKLTLFLVVILLAIYPTLFFRKSKKSTEDLIKRPKVIIMLIRMQLLLVFIIPFFGVLIAKGQ